MLAYYISISTLIPWICESNVLHLAWYLLDTHVCIAFFQCFKKDLFQYTYLACIQNYVACRHTFDTINFQIVCRAQKYKTVQWPLSSDIINRVLIFNFCSIVLYILNSQKD